ncbi:SH3 domain-containing protein [Lusitaniella coriacea]|uniref:SH3 domain-containing protein n=1 Tax=Lusitaniella coriacea TaxID=1983105 RepID=UPI003CEBDC59
MAQKNIANRSIAIFTLLLSVTGGGWANAAMPSAELTDLPANKRILLSQRLIGQCRAAKREIFIYRGRSTDTQKLQALSTNERVRLADNAVDGSGWIAIDEPRAGFVQAQDLQPCNTPSTGLTGQCRAAKRGIFIYRGRSTDSQKLQALSINDRVRLAEPSGRNGWIEIDRPIRGFVQKNDLLPSCDSPAAATPISPSNTLCRRVIYDGVEGMTIRSGAGLNFPRVGGVFFGDIVQIDPSARRLLDDERRAWVKLTSPVSGWISNGFPDFGERNIAACS